MQAWSGGQEVSERQPLMQRRLLQISPSEHSSSELQMDLQTPDTHLSLSKQVTSLQRPIMHKTCDQTLHQRKGSVATIKSGALRFTDWATHSIKAHLASWTFIIVAATAAAALCTLPLWLPATEAWVTDHASWTSALNLVVCHFANGVCAAGSQGVTRICKQ
jgi:hypothetical protein